MKKIKILGIGNPLFGDDGAGIYVVRKIKSFTGLNFLFDIEEVEYGGLRLIDFLQGYSAGIIVDTILNENYPVGHIHKISIDDLNSSTHLLSFHDVDLRTVISFAKEMGISLPDQILIYAIEIEPTYEFSEKLSDPIKKAVDICAEKILNDIGQLELIDLREIKNSNMKERSLYD